MLDSPQFYAVAIPAVLITAVAKVGFGSGVGGLGVPLMSLAIAPPQAAAILLPILCLMDLFSWWAYRGKWDRSNMRIMLPAAMFGMALGTAMFGLLEPDHIRLMLGFIAVAFALDHWLRPKQPNPKSPNVVTGSFWSAAAGFTSFLAHSGGPPLSVYLLPQRLDRTVFVATSVFFFFVVNYVKLIPYAWLGLFDFTNLATSAVLAPLAPLGIWLGLVLHKRISDRLFYQICYAALFVVGIKLLWDGASGYF